MLFPSRDSNSVRESLKIFVLSRGSNIVYEKVRNYSLFPSRDSNSV